MKKLVCLTIASAMVMAMVATGVSADSITNSRNNVSTAVNSYITTGLPAFRTGDTITFNLTGLTNSGELTVISTKWDTTGSGSLSSVDGGTLQYLNQYTLSATDDPTVVSYKIRDDAPSGIYSLRINDDNGVLVKDFFYKIGSVDVKVLTSDGVAHSDYAEPYIVRQYQDGSGKYSVGFIAKAVIEDPNVTFSDLNAGLGFRVKNSSNDKTTVSYFDTTAKLAALDSYVRSHAVNGKFSIVYGVTVDNIDNASAAGNLTAQAYVE